MAIEEYMTTEDNKNQDGKEDDKDNKFPQLSEDSICFDMPRFMINKNGSSSKQTDERTLARLKYIYTDINNLYKTD